MGEWPDFKAPPQVARHRWDSHWHEVKRVSGPSYRRRRDSHWHEVRRVPDPSYRRRKDSSFHLDAGTDRNVTQPVGRWPPPDLGPADKK